MRKKVFLILGICMIAYFIKVDKSDEIFGWDGTILTTEFVGTYNCETELNNCYFSVQPDENIFCYYNPMVNVYIEGQMEKCEEDTYLLTGDGFETQMIVLDGLKFSLYIDDVKLDFIKTTQIPIFPTPYEELA
ncbi:MAG: hypothetical protein ACK5I7_06525 [Anaerotignum sp.]